MSEHVHTPQCDQILGSLSEYIDGELKDELCAMLEAHLQECENCRIVVDTMRKTIELYKEFSTPDELPGEVRQRLYAKLELQGFENK